MGTRSRSAAALAWAWVGLAVGCAAAQVGCDAIAGITDGELVDASVESSSGGGGPDASNEASTDGAGHPGDATASDAAPTDGPTDALTTAEGSTCTSGVPCSPAACQSGVTTCSASGATTCTPTGTASNGFTCDGGAVCDNGACVACSAGTDCSEAGSCQAATVACSTGAPVCAGGGNAPNGKSCGANLYCDNGTCAPCTNGGPCVPAGNPCHTGTLACGDGGILCTDTGSNATDGSSCGSNMVCSAGQCAPCTTGVSCNPPGNTCQTGATSCATGTSTCAGLTNATNGAPCGTNEVCDNGQCGPCATGATCNPSGNVCQTGTTACSTGLPVCGNLTSVGDKTTCGTNEVCCGGTCATCSTPTNATLDCSGTSCGFTCNAGFTACGNTCANLTGGSDAANCGACGRSCLGGTCAAGICQPWVVAQPPTTSLPQSIATDGTNVFWADGTTNTVEQIPATGGTPIVLATGTSQGTFVRYGSGKVVYVFYRTALGLATAGVANSGSTLLNLSSTVVNGLAINPSGTHYFYQGSSGSYDCPIGGSCALALSATQDLADADNTYMFGFISSGTIKRWSLPTLTSTSYTVTGGLSGEVHSDGTSVFWNSGASYQLYSTPEANPVFAPTQLVAMEAYPFVSDGTNVYFVDASTGTGGSLGTVIKYVSVGGGTVTTIASGYTASQFAVAGNLLVWINDTVAGGQIWAVVVP